MGAGARLPVGLLHLQSAARAGQLEVLQWVRKNDASGEVWSENHVRLWCAAGPREQEVLTWLDELNAP